MTGSGLPGRLPLIFRFSRAASLPVAERFYSPVNLLSRAGTFILVNRRTIQSNLGSIVPGGPCAILPRI